MVQILAEYFKKISGFYLLKCLYHYPLILNFNTHCPKFGS